MGTSQKYIGTDSGIALEALSRDYRLLATLHTSSRLGELKDKGAITMNLHVIASWPDLEAIAAEADNVYGRLNILANAAGFLLAGAIEESR